MHRIPLRGGNRESGFAPVHILVIILVIAVLATVAIPALITQSLTNASSVTLETPKWNKIVVVPMENKQYSDVIGSSNAPYLNSLASAGASFTDSNEVNNGGLPNYLALFAGSTFGYTASSCPVSLTQNNLEEQLEKAGKSFTSYSQSMPSDGYTGCTSGAYTRTHNAIANFTNTNGAEKNKTFGSFPTDYSKLPDVSFVVPDNNNNMKTAGATGNAVKSGDEFMRTKLKGYVDWAKNNNSLLVVTWVENGQTTSRIPTIMYGANVKPGQYSQKINHFNVAAMIQDSKGLPRAGSTVGIPGIVIPFGSTEVSPSPAPTSTASPSVSPSPTATPTATATASPTPTQTAVPTATASPSPTTTASPAPTASPSPTQTTTPVSPAPSDSSSTEAAKVFNWGTPVAGDEFNYTGKPDSTKWSMYNGPGHAGKGLRSPDAFNVANGMVTVTGDSAGKTGGMSAKFANQTYGRWEARMRASSDRDSEYHPVLILWPTSGWDKTINSCWEIDYAEGYGSKSKMHFVNHFGCPATSDVTKDVDNTQWHNYAVEWSPSGVIGYIDGVKWFEDTNPAHISNVKMFQTIQLDWFPDGTATNTSTMDVDWVRVYNLK